MLRPSSLLVLLAVRYRTAAPVDVSRSSLLPIRCLFGSRVCYPADWPIAGAGLSPARKAAVIGCTGNYKDGFSIEGSATGTRLYNCIGVNNGLTTNEFDLWVDSGSASGFVSNYNVFWNSTSQPERP